VVIEQAKGVLAERAHVNLDDAFHARNHSRRLRDVAETVIAGSIAVEELVARSSGAPQAK
jgi:hypothetical protein